MFSLLRFIVVVAVIWHSGFTSATAEVLPKQTGSASKTERVLVLWSFPRVYPWILQVDGHFTEYARLELDQKLSSQFVVLEEENLPFQGGITAQWSASYLEYIREKYSEREFDRIVTIDAAASRFMSERYHLFNYNQLYQITQKPIETTPKAVILDPPAKTGEWAWQALDQAFTPGAQTTYLIANENSLLNETGQTVNAATRWLDQGNHILLDPAVLTIEQIRQQLIDAPDDSRILYLPVTSTTTNNDVIPRQFLIELVKGIKKPIYCTVSSFIGAGCLAGYGQSSRLFAKLAAAAVYDALPPGSTNDLSELMLDEAKLQELGKSRPDWYSDSLVVNPKLTAWERYPEVIVVGSLLIGFFSSVLIILSRQRTQLNNARLAAQAKQNRLDHIIKGTNVGTWEWNIQTGETLFNERWAEIVGYTLEELQPTTIDTWMKLAHPKDLEGSEKLLNEHFEGRSDFYELQARMKHKEGHWVWVLDRGQVATWTIDGKPEWMYGTHQEISEQKSLEAQLLTRTAEAENALKVKSEFLAAMSHEIRTPMNGVLGLAELGRNNPSLEKKDFYLEGITRSGKLLMGILNDVLDFSRLEAGRTKLQLEGFETASLFSESLDLFRASAESKGLALKLELSQDIPKRLFGDPIKLSQMINNYIGNAIKFTARGSITVKVSCTFIHERVKLYLECLDTGVGIPEEDVRQLFKPFSQVSRDSRVKASGTGLGLVLVQEYAKLMDGKCGVSSNPGRGSVFWFDVLLDKSEDQETACTHEVVTDPTQLMGKHLLIVEDNSMNVLIIEAMLDQYQITHDVACDGVEAIRLFESSFEHGCRQYDAILMDVQMPVMNGLEATRIIKSNRKKAPPVLGLTAAVLPDEMQACRDSGMDAFIGKPIDTRKLFSELLRLTNPVNT